MPLKQQHHTHKSFKLHVFQAIPVCARLIKVTTHNIEKAMRKSNMKPENQPSTCHTFDCRVVLDATPSLYNRRKGENGKNRYSLNLNARDD
eukprot:6466779-Amphidinium_carterae.1